MSAKVLRCDGAAVTGITETGAPQVALLHFDAEDPQDRLVPVGVIIDGGLEVYSSAARRIVFSPRVLHMLATEVDHWSKKNRSVN